MATRERGENMLKGGLSALGGRARNELSKRTRVVRFLSVTLWPAGKAPLIEVANAVLPENYGLIPVLSNLAVSRCHPPSLPTPSTLAGERGESR